MQPPVPGCIFILKLKTGAVIPESYPAYRYYFIDFNTVCIAVIAGGK
jgi:hypothetical protein